jgi:fumarate reductase subunit D
MRKSIEPALWLLFAAGGLLAALVTPALILVTGVLAPLAWLDLAYPRMLAIAGTAGGKLALFVAIALPAWHAAYRLRMTIHDLGLGGGSATKLICYGAAGLLIGVSIAALLAI